MDSRFPDSVLSRLYGCGVVACLTIEDPKTAVPAATALLAGGISVMELTLRTPTALESFRRIKGEVPEMLAGVGTILTSEQVRAVVDAGADFGVAPGISERVVRAAQDLGLPFAPGIATPSELEKGLELGCREMKFFPAEPMGGVPYLKSMRAPYAHLGVRFLPLGGLNLQNVEKYLQEPSVLAVGGSWLVTTEMLRAENWQAITAAARAAADSVTNCRTA